MNIIILYNFFLKILDIFIEEREWKKYNIIQNEILNISHVIRTNNSSVVSKTKTSVKTSYLIIAQS